MISRSDLQGLSALALFAILADYTDITPLQGGFIGIDIFFVLSGYLITGLFLHTFAEEKQQPLFLFYTNALKRILPAFLVMFSVVTTLAIWTLPRLEAHALLNAAPFAASWSSNLHFAFIGLDYFNELARRDLFLHTWPLGVIGQFYLIWPPILLVLYRRGKTFILSGITLLLIASFALSLYWSNYITEMAFYLLPARLWQFLLGALLVVPLWEKTSTTNALPDSASRLTPYFMLSAGLLLILTATITLNPDLTYPGLWSLIPSLGTTLIILAGSKITAKGYNPLSHPILTWLGHRAYGGYLWFWPLWVLTLSFEVNGPLNSLFLPPFLALLIATLSFRFIEYPFQTGRWSQVKPLSILLASLLATATLLLALSYGIPQPLPQKTPRELINLWRMDQPIIQQMPCDTGYSNKYVKPCVFGTAAAQKTVVLFGDSIGTQWFSLIPALFPEPMWRSVVLTKATCPLVDAPYYYQKIGKVYQVCTDWRNLAIEGLTRLKPDIVIMGNAATYPFNQIEWTTGSSQVIQQVRQVAKTVIVIPGTPQLGFDGPTCVAQNRSLKGQVSRTACVAQDQSSRIENVATHLSQVVNPFPNVHLLNLNDLVCPDGECNAISPQGVVVFRDNQHLTDTFVRSQFSVVKQRVQQILSQSSSPSP